MLSFHIGKRAHYSTTTKKGEIAMSTILFTGATGQVGSSLAPLLQKRGHRVLYLIRANNDQDVVTRLRGVLPYLRKEDVVINGDVTLPNAGISEEDRKKWNGRIDKVIHGAASIKFDEAVAEETRHININGTSTMLNLAKEFGVQEFHFISTAYVAGSARTFAETDFDVGQTARNAYESSKWAAERLVREWPNGKFTIHRPGIVIGDSKTGYVQSFNGYYGFFIGFWRLLQNLCQKWEAKKEDCLQQGISFSEDGFLNLPLCIDCSPISRLNLVTTDWLSSTLAQLVDLPALNQTFQLIHPTPPRVQWVIEASLDHLRIKGIQYRDSVDFSQYPMLQRFQDSLDRNLNRYLPYVTHEPIFDCTNLRRVLAEHYVAPPAIDKAILIRMLDYAKSVNFGRGAG